MKAIFSTLIRSAPLVVGHLFSAITLLSAVAVRAAEPTFANVTDTVVPGYISPKGPCHGYLGGGLLSVYVVLQGDWIVVNTNSWITITSPTNCTGSSAVTYSVAVNPDPQLRSGNITIGDHNFLVTQLANDPVFDTQPTNQSALVGGTATFSVSVRGTPPFTYQWYLNDSPLADGDGISGASTSNLVLTGIQQSQAGNYRAWVTSAGGRNDSSKAKLTVASNGTENGSATYNSVANPTPPVRSDVRWIANQHFLPTQSLRFMARTATNVTLSVQGEAGKGYVVEGSWDLIHWVPISTNSAPSTVNDAVGNAPQRFYRVVEFP